MRRNFHLVVGLFLFVACANEPKKEEVSFTSGSQALWIQDERALPAHEPLRHNSGHHGSHTFITHEFVDACLKERKPTVNIHEALAYTMPGVIAHESALKGGLSMTIPQFD